MANSSSEKPVLTNIVKALLNPTMVYKNTSSRFCFKLGHSCSNPRYYDVLNESVNTHGLTATRTVGYPMILTIGIIGLGLNLLLLHTIWRMNRDRVLTWKNRLFVLNTSVLDTICCLGLVLDALIHIGFASYKPAMDRLCAFEIFILITVLYIPAMGYAFQGVCQLIAVRFPLFYQRHFDDRIFKKLIIAQWLCGLVLQAIGVTFSRLYHAGGCTWRDTYKSTFVLNILLAPYLVVVLTVFCFCYVSLTHALLKRSLGNGLSKQNVASVKQLQLQLAVQTACELTFLAVHILNLKSILAACHMMLESENYDCETCMSAAALSIKLNTYLSIQYIAYNVWCVRAIIEPSLMLFANQQIRNYFLNKTLVIYDESLFRGHGSRLISSILTSRSSTESATEDRRISRRNSCSPEGPETTPHPAAEMQHSAPY